MACKICGRNNCDKSFHTLEEQDDFDDRFGKYITTIDEQKNKIKTLEKENETLWLRLTPVERDELEKELSQ